jgi:PST family polysaccharide transporter
MKRDTRLEIRHGRRLRAVMATGQRHGRFGGQPMRYGFAVVQSVDEHSQPAESLTPLRATAVVGLGSVVALALSVVTAKVYALLVGPMGIGLLALMQSVLVVGVMIASGGLATSAVRAIAAVAESHLRALTERATILVGLIGGSAGAVILIALREPFAGAVLGSESHSGMVVLVAFALMLSTVAAVQVALLTGLHRVHAVVLVNLGTSLGAAIVGVGLVAWLGETGLAPALLATAGIQFVLSRAVLRRATEAHRVAERVVRVNTRARELVVGGMPVAVGQLAGSGSVFLVPVIVLQLLTTTDVGYYRAAAAISVGYLTFFLATLSQDYLPRLSLTSDRDELRELVERRMRLLMSLGIPIIMALLAAAPWVIHILYTSQFAPASDVLRWQLVGDLLRLPAWVLVYVLLARERPGPYVAAEVVGGVALMLVTFLCLSYFGLVGAGVGYAIAQLIYLGVTLTMVWRLVGAAPGRLQAVTLGTAMASTVILLVPMADMGRSVIFGMSALAFAAIAWPRVYALHREGAL